MLLSVWCLCSSRLAAQTWITTNLTRLDNSSNGYLGEYELTPSVDKSIPHFEEYSNNAARLFLRIRERLAILAHGSATYGGKIMVDVEARVAEPTNTAAVSDAKAEFESLANQSRILIKYYRGRLRYTLTNTLSREWVTVFTSDKNTRLVMVRDQGPIFFSEDSGCSWKAITNPGQYEFTMSATPKGSVVVALVTLTNVPVTFSDQMLVQNWSSVVSAANGDQLVLTGGPTQSAPVLNIQGFTNSVIVSWPASFNNFVLQQCGDLTAPNWEDVGIPVEVVNKQNQVLLPVSPGSRFFRLRNR
jgi:hypothetical protein